MKFNTKDIILLVIGALLGVITSEYYFQKSTYKRVPVLLMDPQRNHFSSLEDFGPDSLTSELKNRQLFR